MRKKLLLFFLLLQTGLGFSQIFVPGGGGQPQGPIKQHATFSITPSKTKVKRGEIINLVFSGKIDKDWKLYSNNYQCDPIKFEVNLNSSTKFQPVGGLIAVGDSKHYDEIFECDYRSFKEKATFIQKVRILGPTSIGGKYSGQTCRDDESGICQRVDGDFLTVAIQIDESTGGNTISDPGITVGPITGGCNCCEQMTYNDSVYKARFDSLQSLLNDINLTLNPPSSGGGSGGCVIPRRPGFEDIKIIHYDQLEASKAGAKVEADKIEDKEKEDSFSTLLWFFVLSFLAGLGALLTPCLFPLIPMTVSFFTKDKEAKGKGVRDALLYGLFIILIYSIIGIIFSKLFGPTIQNHLATGWLNIVFFLIFFIFALSFLGMFDIVIPTGFVNRMDKKAEKGGVIGIFFMAFVLTLVTFSCTGPIVSTVIVQAAKGSWVKPIVGMLGFSIAIALPFMLFAMFPRLMNKLPKSGGWLNVVKVIFGFLELALAFKFLSVADLASHWGLLDRDVFLAIWIAIFGAMGIYLLGKIRLPHDSPMEKLSVSRLMLGLATLSFVIYLIPGLWGAPLKGLSGILPPSTTQDFDIEEIVLSTQSTSNELCQKPMYADDLELPHNLSGYFDLRQAICCALEQDKPIFVDFTGHGCANCRQMEEQVWSRRDIKDMLDNDFIILSMYVDDKVLQLPIDERFKDEEGETVKLLGEYNTQFQLQKFHQFAQPYYLILSVNKTKTKEGGDVFLNVLQQPINKTSADKFKTFLQDGIKEHIELSKISVEISPEKQPADSTSTGG